MNQRNTNWLILIIVLVAISVWVDFPLNKTLSLPNPFNDTVIFSKNADVKLGLDLRGGLQALLEADLPADVNVDAGELGVTRQILESRANGLGVSEVVMQTAGDRRIVAEFPGASNPEEVVAALQQTGLLEFVDFQTNPLKAGTVVQTDYAQQQKGASSPTATPAPVNPGATPPPTNTNQPPAPTIYHTVMTGSDLKTVTVSTDSRGRPAVSFELTSNGTKIFADYTTSHTQQFLGIVLDHKVISAPQVNEPITSGSGIISGSFTVDEANTLKVNLQYGSLPIPIKVVESRSVGPTLGAESIRKSVRAGLIGFVVIILFMGLYYRLPGMVADLALIIYVIFTLAVYKLGIPGLFPYITLTLPGIAGFILSVGMAVDANILIFERLKEELRAGRNLRQAIDLGWSRAWPSIRDANISTIITCLILLVFGSQFGASMVKGFSITLLLGVLISLFTAIIVTRTFLHILLDNLKLSDHPRWFGL